MNAKQSEDMVRNILDFKLEYTKKYIAGQKEHTGNLWEMGLKQAVGNAKEEVLDLWSYLMTIEKVISELENIVPVKKGKWIIHQDYISKKEMSSILNRTKED